MQNIEWSIGAAFPGRKAHLGTWLRSHLAPDDERPAGGGQQHGLQHTIQELMELNSTLMSKLLHVRRT